MNFEQNLAPNLHAFARFGWNNDKTESFAYTEVGQTVATGLGAMGPAWHRRFDRAGIAFISNAISKDHQTYLADGSLGFLIGDGKLTYGRETILESYTPPMYGAGFISLPACNTSSTPATTATVAPSSSPASAPTSSSSRLYIPH